jgi:hypothetical protein
MHISGYEPRGNSAQAQRGYHQHCEVTTTAAPEIRADFGWVESGFPGRFG